MTETDYTVTAIGWVRSPRAEAIDDDWGGIESTIAIDGERYAPDVLAGLDDFSHIEVVFLFDQVAEDRINLGARHPRNREDWPLVGIFAQRAKARPNRLGITTCELVEVDGLDVHVRGLDAIDGTPVLDVKPHVREFGPRGEVRQPAWISELMTDYW
ncbi:MAG: SAM-dependent methyltransferase [Actinomycetota bacterium]